MLNTIWAVMILVGVIVGILTGNMEAVGNGVLESAGSAVTLCITMMGILSMWTGLMQVARASGLLEKMAGWLSPVIVFLFPKIPKDSKAAEYIATNMVANVLGLGWAATPAGIKAMEELAVLEEKRGTPGYEKEKQGINMLEREREERVKGMSGYERKEYVQGESAASKESTPRAASNEMCTLLVVNMSSLQLIPINMIAYRSQYGSASPAAIVAPVIVATVISTIVAVAFCKLAAKTEDEPKHSCKVADKSFFGGKTSKQLYSSIESMKKN